MTLTKEQIDATFDAIAAALNDSGADAAWDAAEPLLTEQSSDRDAARALLYVVDRRHFSKDRRIETLERVEAAYSEDPSMMSFIGELFEAVTDINYLNSAPPTDPFFEQVIHKLDAMSKSGTDADAEETILFGLASGARVLGRQFDAIAEQSYKRLIEIDPQRSAYRYNLGLFYKTRGRFAEGLAANQEAVDLADEPSEGMLWNLGICATGAGDAQAALEVWRGMGHKLEMGRFDLPEGRWPQCQVRLSERPLAARDAANDDPGMEETIWIQRLSACHGIVRSVLYQDLGVDYGDVVLFDGAPITYHTFGDDKVPVFPHLVTLRRRGYQYFAFAGTQEEARQLADVSTDLERDSIVYSHTESFRTICGSCWEDPDVDHDEHTAEEKHVVNGRISAPPDIEPADLLAQIDAALTSREPCRIYSPDLCLAAGEPDRARFEQPRFDSLSEI